MRVWHWLWPEVVVETRKPGVCYAVTSVERAADLLLEWNDQTPNWQAAVLIVMSCLEGGKSPMDVRAAFEAAARANGKLIVMPPP